MESESTNEDSTVSKRGSSPGKLLTSFALYFCFIAHGLSYNIWGPTWVDLVSLLNSTQEAMAYGTSLMAIGFCIGAFSGGYLFEYLNRQLMVVMYLLLLATTTTLMPLLKNYKIFLALSIFFGIGEGGFETATNAWMLEMWKDDNGPYMQALHFTFGLGSLLAPVISFPFLININPSNSTYDNSDVSFRPSPSQFGSHHKQLISVNHRFHHMIYPKHHIIVPNITSEEDFKLFIPYSICGVMLLLSSIVVLIYYIIGKYEPENDKSSLKDTNDTIDFVPNISSKRESLTTVIVTDIEVLINNRNRKSITTISTSYKLFLIMIGSAMFCFYEGMETLNFDYIATFATDTKLNLSDKSGAYIASALSASFTICRGIGILLAIKVRPKYFIYFNLLIIMIGHSCLYIFANTSETLLLMSVIIVGCGFGTLTPSLYSYMEQHMRLTNVICGIFLLSCASIGTIDPIIVGRYLKSDAYILIYVNIVSTTLVAIAFITIEMTAYIKRQENERNNFMIN